MRAWVPAIVAVSLLAAGCGSSPRAAAPSRSALAFARCMRSHGVPSFPDPDPRGGFPSFHAGVSKQTSSAADSACRHLLPGGTATPQQQRRKLAFAVDVARCLRTHGYPSFPDPSRLGSQSPPGIDESSPRFQSTESDCESRARKALHLP